MQEFSLIKKNILKYLEYKGVTPYRFYKETSITRGILTQNNGITEENLLKFVAYAQDISLTWLLTGEGSMLRSDEQPVVSSDLPEIAQDSELIVELRSHIASLNSRITEQEQYIDDLRSVVRTLSK